MEKNTEDANVSTEEQAEDTEKGLSLRDALEVALEASADGGDGRTEGSGGDVDNTREAVDVAGKTDSASDSTPEPALEPPAEFTAEEKDDFKQLTRKQQEAQLRLHKSRLSRLSEIKQAAEEFKYAQKLAEAVTPYLKARGHKEPAEHAVQKAVALYLETKENPKRAVAAILRAHGMEVPRELIDEKAIDPVEEKIAPLQNELQALKSERAQEQQRQAAAALNSVWTSFEQAKSASGVARFPDIQPDKGEAGMRLAAQIGSLVSGQTPLSQQWIGLTKERIPGATFETLLVEAYKYFGGRVDDASTTRTQTNPQQHLARSNRAASSVPGRGAGLNSRSTDRKFKSYREAAAAALAELNDG